MYRIAGKRWTRWEIGYSLLKGPAGTAMSQRRFNELRSVDLHLQPSKHSVCAQTIHNLAARSAFAQVGSSVTEPARTGTIAVSAPAVKSRSTDGSSAHRSIQCEIRKNEVAVLLDSARARRWAAQR